MWQGVGFSIGIKLSNFLLKTWNHLFCANTSNWNWLEKVTIVCLLLMSRNVSDISTSFWNKNEPEKKKLKRTTKGEKQQIHTTSDWTHQTQLLSMQLLPIRNIWNPLMAPEKKASILTSRNPDRSSSSRLSQNPVGTRAGKRWAEWQVSFSERAHAEVGRVKPRWCLQEGSQEGSGGNFNFRVIFWHPVNNWYRSESGRRGRGICETGCRSTT